MAVRGRNLFVVLCVCAATTTAVACGQSETNTAAASGTCGGDELTIAQPSTGYNFFPSYVAEAAGYYDEAGLNVEVLDLGGGPEALSGVVAGSVDVALSVHSSVVEARSKGAPVKSFLGLMDQYGAEVVVKADAADVAGVSDTSPIADKVKLLDGMNIGVTSAGSGTDQAIRYIMRSQGLDPDEAATIVAVGSGNGMVGAFTQGKVDAVIISSPTADIAAQRGNGTKLFSMTKGEFEPLNPFLYITAIAREDTLASQKSKLGCFASAIQKALDLIKNDPKRAAELARPFYGDLDDNMYNTVLFDVALPSFPASVLIDPKSADIVIDFVNASHGDPVDVTTDESVDFDIANEVVTNP